jgi:hypothetical protein
MSYAGVVQNGVIMLENGTQLSEGTRVQVIVAEVSPEGETLGQRLMKLAGIAGDGLPEDLAENHDHYLHGRPKK